MGTTHRPQDTGHAILASGNVAIVAVVDLDDPAVLPLGGPAEPGEWAETTHIEDPGEQVIRDFEVDNDEPLVLDPPEIVEPDFDPDVPCVHCFDQAA